MSKNREKYLRGIEGIALQKKYHLDAKGVWHVEGENGETGMGPSTAKNFGLFQGSLSDVIDYVVDLPGFWEWGRGGTITKAKIEKLDSLEFAEKKRLRKALDEARKTVADLEFELKTVEDQT